MSEIEPPSETDQAKSLWCPGCLRQVPTGDEELHVTFTPQAWDLEPTGRLDTGYDSDVFMDYDHLPCGTHVRVVSNAGWSEELSDYIAQPRNAFIEVTIRGEYQSSSESIEDPDDPDYRDVSPFSSSVESEPATWGSTYYVLLDMYKEALTLLKGRIGDDE